MSYQCTGTLACPSCGMGCNYDCNMSPGDNIGDCICVETTPGNGACEGKESVPAILSADDIRKTRGVPGMGSTGRGPRGQELAFRNFSASRGTQPWRRFDGGRSNMMDKSASQYVMGLLGVGILFFVIGYGYQEGKKAA